MQASGSQPRTGGRTPAFWVTPDSVFTLAAPLRLRPPCSLISTDPSSPGQPTPSPTCPSCWEISWGPGDSSGEGPGGSPSWSAPHRQARTGGEARIGWLGLGTRVKSAQSKGDWEGGPRGLWGPREKWKLGSGWLKSLRGMETGVR